MKIVCPVHIFPSSNCEAVNEKLWRLTGKQRADVNKNWEIECIIDKRLYNSMDTTMDTYKELKYSLLKCHGLMVNCDVDRRLYTTVTTCTAIPFETVIYGKNEISDFEALILTVHHVRQKTVCTRFWTNIFLPVVEKKSSILCRLLLTVISEQEKQAWQKCRTYLIDGLSYAMANQDNDTSRTIAWFITKMFFKSLSYNVRKHILDIWPASQCDCLDRRLLFCSKQLAIIVEMDASCSEIPNRFWESEVKYITHNNVSNTECTKVHEHFQNSSSSSFQNEISISGIEAKLLFDEHTNLCLIDKSPYKSNGFLTSNHEIIKQSCVQLYCKKKGFIPIGENHFPRNINGMHTDILEGRPRLLSNLKVGDQVGRDDYKKGTLGGFVRVYGKTAFLSCAHVFVDVMVDDKPAFDHNEILWINLYEKNRTTRCGRVIMIDFCMDNANETSIDAVLVQLTDDVNIDGSNYVSSTKRNLSFRDIGMRSMYLNDSCVDFRPLCFSVPPPILHTVSVAAVSGCFDSNESRVLENREKSIDLETTKHTSASFVLEDIKENVRHTIRYLQSLPEPVLLEKQTIEKHCRSNISAKIKNAVVEVIHKVYLPSQSILEVDIDRVLNELEIEEKYSVVSGYVHMQQTSLSPVDLKMAIRRSSRRCYNQISISNMPFQPGDSGTCIYVINPVKGCIGMAIADHPHGGCIATPILDILQRFRIL